MADLTPGVELAKRLDDRYAQQLERRVGARQANETARAEADDAARQAELAARTRANQATDEARRLDAEQVRREQQQAAELRRLDEDRQAAVADAHQAEQTPERGAIVDILA